MKAPPGSPPTLDMTDGRALPSALRDGRERFLAFVAGVRPDLHRYCARMTGSVSDGEDIVQETLARAYYALPEVEEMPVLRPWLFQIAHRRALDHLRRYDRRMGQPLDDEIVRTLADGAEDAEDAVAHEEALHVALARFLELPPTQRSCVILKDVLGHPAEEIAEFLGLTVAAVRSALHRGRARLRARGAAAQSDAPPARRQASPTVTGYAALFNARDWDGVRAMLAEDVQLEVVARLRRSGRPGVSGYFTNYGSMADWHLVPAWLEGREVLAVFRDPRDARPGYFIELGIVEDRIKTIRDFRYVDYIGRDAEFDWLPPHDTQAKEESR
jgi:RNA polymerase sigma factor (sigma-70 family)